MATTKKWNTGDFCWSEVGTTDVNRTKAFYGELMGWTAKDHPMPEGMTYTLFQVNGQDVGGCYPLQPEQVKNGVPPHWLSSIWAEDIDAVAARTPKLGGKVLMPPMSMNGDSMRFAVLQDSTGAQFGVFKNLKENKGAPQFADGTHGVPCWNELMTKDAAEALRFYGELFHWRAGKMENTPNEPGMMNYTILKSESMPQGLGGMMQMDANMAKNVPTHWEAYYTADNCDDRVNRAKKLGATILVPPTDIPTVGRFSTIQDPLGAVFSILQPFPRQK